MLAEGHHCTPKGLLLSFKKHRELHAVKDAQPRNAKAIKAEKTPEELAKKAQDQKENRIKKLLARAFEEDPLKPAGKKPLPDMTPDEEYIYTFAKDRIRDKKWMGSLVGGVEKTQTSKEEIVRRLTATEKELTGKLETLKKEKANEARVETSAQKTLEKAANSDILDNEKPATSKDKRNQTHGQKQTLEDAQARLKAVQKAKNILFEKDPNPKQGDDRWMDHLDQDERDLLNEVMMDKVVKAEDKRIAERPQKIQDALYKGFIKRLEAAAEADVFAGKKPTATDIEKLNMRHAQAFLDEQAQGRLTAVARAKGILKDRVKGVKAEPSETWMENLRDPESAKVREKLRERRLEALFRDVPPRERKAFVQRVMELHKEGVFDDETYRDAVAKKLKINPLTPEDAKRIHGLAVEVQNATDKIDRTVKTAQLMAEIARLQPPGTLKKVAGLQSMAQLLNPKTAIRNVVGNQLFSAAETGSGVLANVLDMGISKITGQRSRVFPQMGAMKSGAVRGWKEGYRDAVMGIDTSGGALGKYDLPSNHTFKNPVLKSLETALNIELRATDRAFYGMAYRESLLNQVKTAKTNGAKARITPEMVTTANLEALYKTFQDDSHVAKGLVGIKKALNAKKDFGLGDFVLKYPKTPGNLISRAFAYSPAGFAKPLFHVATAMTKKGKFDQRAFTMEFSRAFTGTGVCAGGYMLGRLGLATGGRGDDKDISAVQKASGARPLYSVNASGILRYASSGFNVEAAKRQPGDKWVSFDFAQPMAAPFAAGVAIGEGQDAKNAAYDYGNAVTQGADALTGQSVLQGLQQLFGGRSGSMSEGLTKVAASAPASFVPTALSQVNQSIDNTNRETAGKDWLATIGNTIKAKIPGLAQTLPKRKNVYGEDDERYQDGSNNLFNVFLNPAFIKTVKSDPTGDEVLRLFEEAGETKQAPHMVQHSIQIQKESGQKLGMKLDGEQISKYQEYVGKRSKHILDTLVQNPAWKQLSDDEKADIMGHVLTNVNTAAKVSLFGHRPSKIDPAAFAIASDDEAGFWEKFSGYVDRKLTRQRAATP